MDMEETYDHLSYSSKEHTSSRSLDRNVSKYSNISFPREKDYDRVYSAPGGREVSTARLSNWVINDPKVPKPQEKPKDKCWVAVISVIIVFIVTGMMVSVVVGITVHLENKVRQEQLLLNDLNTEIEELSRTWDEKLDHKIGKLNNSIHVLQEKLNDTLKEGQSFYALPSCAAIFQRNPSSTSGYYFIYSFSQKRRLKVYCDMTKTCGDSASRGWMRVTQMNISQPSSKCPPGLCLDSAKFRTCKICGDEEAWSLDVFSVGVSYSRVCGRILGYQVGSVDGFLLSPIGSTTHYDGIDLTYGKPTKHIWTFIIAKSEVYSDPAVVCPCINTNDFNIPPPPSFVGSNYFCDTAAIYKPPNGHFFSNNTLWDGNGCSNSNQCCSFNRPPWFFRQLPHPTTDDIEMSVCRTGKQRTEDIAIETIDIFVQ